MKNDRCPRCSGAGVRFRAARNAFGQRGYTREACDFCRGSGRASTVRRAS